MSRLFDFEKWKKDEPQYIYSTLAFMCFNPSIGRALNKGSVKKFTELALKRIKNIGKIKSQNGFDKFHDNFVKAVRDECKASYGQAQKPVNVFLKVLVDWANRPSHKVAKKVRPFLHVPLDSRLITCIKKKIPCFRNKSCQSKLKEIDKKQYKKWQQYFHRLYPQKPILCDILWWYDKERENS